MLYNLATRIGHTAQDFISIRFSNRNPHFSIVAIVLVINTTTPNSIFLGSSFLSDAKNKTKSHPER